MESVAAIRPEQRACTAQRCRHETPE